MTGQVPDRRIHERREHRTKVVFNDEFGDGLFYVYSRDMSMGGIFLASDIPAKLGTLLFLSFEIPPHKRPVSATGEVVRRIGGKAKKNRGMGIRFVGLDAMTKKRLEEFLGG